MSKKILKMICYQKIVARNSLMFYNDVRMQIFLTNISQRGKNIIISSKKVRQTLDAILQQSVYQKLRWTHFTTHWWLASVQPYLQMSTLNKMDEFWKMSPIPCYGTKANQHQKCLMCHLKMSMKMIPRQVVLETKLESKVLCLKPFPSNFDIEKGII